MSTLSTVFRLRVKRFLFLASLCALPIVGWHYANDSRISDISWHRFKDAQFQQWHDRKVMTALGLTRNQYEARHGQVLYSFPNDAELDEIIRRGKIDYAVHIALVTSTYFVGLIIGQAVILFFIIGHGLPWAVRFVKR